MRRLLIVAITSVGLGILVLVVLANLHPSPLDPILNPNRIEVVSVKWGNMVNSSYEPEDARWINFTVFNHGENQSFVDNIPKAELLILDDNSKFSVIDRRGWFLLHGENEVMMMGRTSINFYQLKVGGKILWEGKI